MMPIEEIRKQLQDRSPKKVALACGVHFQTVRAIRDGKNTNPTLRVMEALSSYLQRK